MEEQIKQFSVELFQDVPLNIYKWLLAFFCFCALLVFVFRGLKRGWRLVCCLLLAEYSVLIFLSTVFFRPYKEEIGSNFIPFWSYFAYDQVNRPDLLPENILNIAVFVPIGLLLGCAFRSMKWWKVLLIGGSASIMIETLQFFYKRGFAETDDVMHNTLGCLIGFGLYSLIKQGYEKNYKRRMFVL